MEFTVKRQIEVGIFVAVGTAILALSILFLGEDTMIWRGSYTLKVAMKQVQGLSKGSMVFVSGVRVGNIADIRFRDSDDDLDLILTIDKRFQGKITVGSVASIRTLGALGDKYIYIEPGPRDASPIKDGGRLQSSESEDFLDILSKKGDELSNITEVITELNSLLKNLNRDGRSALFMENMIQSSHEFKSLLKETRGTISHLTRIAEKVDKGEGTLGALINDPTIHQKLSTFLGDSPRKNHLKSAIRESIRLRENREPMR